LVDRELNSLCSGPRPEVIHSRLQALLPPIEMHACQLAKRRRLEVDIEGLRLADVSTSIGGEIEYFLLGDLPNGFVDCLDVVRDSRDILNGAIMRDNHVLHLVIPETEVDEFAEKPGADDLELPSEDTTRVDVAIWISLSA
jgi:hypothetical protein